MDLFGSDDAHIQEYKRECRDVFDSVDVDGSGVIEKGEFIEAVKSNKKVADLVNRSRLLSGLVATGELEGAFQQFDKDGGGTLNFEEFWEFCKTQADEDNIRQMFAAIDVDGSRYITYDELVSAFKSNAKLLSIVKGSKVFGKLIEENDWEKVLAEMDTNASGADQGRIDFVEFWSWCKKISAKVQAEKLRNIARGRTERLRMEKAVLYDEVIKRVSTHSFKNGAAQGGVFTVSMAPEIFNFPHLAENENQYAKFVKSNPSR